MALRESRPRNTPAWWKQFGIFDRYTATQSRFEATSSISDRIGKRPFDVAEEFAVEQRLRQRAAVDSHERSAGSIAQLMQRRRDQLLARAGLSHHKLLICLIDKHLCWKRRRSRQVMESAMDQLRKKPATSWVTPRVCVLLLCSLLPSQRSRRF